jgi:ribose transport system permease protein
VGCGIVLWHVAAITLRVTYGFAWPAAVAMTLAGGLINGLLLEVGRIGSFIVTLGTGTIIYFRS